MRSKVNAIVLNSVHSITVGMTGLFHQMKIYDFELIQFEATYADLYICISDGVVNYCQFD